MDLCVQIGFHWTGGIDKKEDGLELNGEKRIGRLEEETLKICCLWNVGFVVVSNIFKYLRRNDDDEDQKCVIISVIQLICDKSIFLEVLWRLNCCYHIDWRNTQQEGKGNEMRNGQGRFERIQKGAY